MFENLQEKLGRAFRLLGGKGRISEKNIEDAIKQIKLSLLEADVNYKVVKEFINGVTEKAMGEEVLKSFTPDQQFIKIVREELIKMLGEKSVPLRLSSQPAKIMMVGLQGSGKTTTTAKLGTLLRKEGKKPLLVAADVYRPAAIDQLIQLGKQIDLPVFTGDRKNPVKIVQDAMQQAVKNINDVVLLDTAGRLHIDSVMMDELKEIAASVKPDEILMVVDAMTGQDAVNSAKAFNEALELSGFVVTKLDGDARGGVILSIKHVTGKPVKFIGVSEKPDGLETFHPERVSGRILGMGDVLSLIDKLQMNINDEKAKKMEENFLKNKFDLEDFLEQLKEVKKLGSLADIVEMIPGAPKDVDLAGSEKSMKRTEAIIHSMSLQERRTPKLLNYSRKQRIARGSGTTVQEINKLLKSYDQMKDMLKKFNKKGKLFKGMKGFPF